MIYKRQGERAREDKLPFTVYIVKLGCHCERKRSATRSNNALRLLPLFFERILCCGWVRNDFRAPAVFTVLGYELLRKVGSIRQSHSYPRITLSHETSANVQLSYAYSHSYMTTWHFFSCPTSGTYNSSIGKFI